MKLLITSICFLLTSLSSFSQAGLDLELKSVSNKELFVWRYMRTNEGWLRTEAENKEILKKTQERKEPIKLYTITSPSGIEVDSLVKKYSKKIVVQKLYALLQDTTKDLHAHLLLVEIFNPNHLVKLFGIALDRNKWLAGGKRSADISYWTEFLKKEKYID